MSTKSKIILTVLIFGIISGISGSKIFLVPLFLLPMGIILYLHGRKVQWRNNKTGEQNPSFLIDVSMMSFFLLVFSSAISVGWTIIILYFITFLMLIFHKKI